MGKRKSDKINYLKQLEFHCERSTHNETPTDQPH